MSRWIKKVHIYIGLLNLSMLLVFGVAGLTATFEHSPEARRRPAPAVEFRTVIVPPNLTDHEAANWIRESQEMSLTYPLPKAAARRDADNNLSFDIYSTSGPRHVTVLEKENRIRIETRRNSVWRYVSNLHSTTANTKITDIRFRLWAWYNEFAIWSLIAMPVSGVYLWLVSRPGHRWARISFAAGSGIFLALYALTR